MNKKKNTGNQRSTRTTNGRKSTGQQASNRSKGTPVQDGLYVPTTSDISTAEPEKEDTMGNNTDTNIVANIKHKENDNLLKDYIKVGSIFYNFNL